MSNGPRAEVKLTPISYIVLGLLDAAGEATPYDLKHMASASIGAVWSVAHSQIYKEPERLAKAGYLNEQRERTGRRRKRYTLTDRGREALTAWLETPETSGWELRYPGLLKLAFGADPAKVASAQLEFHRRKLAELEALHATLELTGAPEGPILVVQSGIAHARQDVRFWSRLAARQGGPHDDANPSSRGRDRRG